MATYFIGDVQGCYRELMALLAKLQFDPAQDTLWFAGDLVNRGPDSLSVLRYVMDLGPSANTVLGNHDLHLLAASVGVRAPTEGDTLDDILNAPDRDKLLYWLRHRPMLHHDKTHDVTLVHAGLAPEWDIATAEALANELEKVLAGDDYEVFVNHMYGNKPRRWSTALEGWERLRFITNTLTRIRYCDPSGALDFEDKQPPGRQGAGLTPWFAFDDRASAGHTIVFGHWATLRLHEPVDPAHGVYHIDLGCVWGGELAALRLEDWQYFSVPAGATPL